MRILFVSGYGINSTNANAECFRKIIESMNKYEDIEADVIGDSIFDEKSTNNWKNNPIIMMQRIIHWPVVQPEAVKKCINYLRGIGLEKYDCVIVPHKPYETVYAACKIKKKYPHIKLYIYALDPIANEIDANNGIGKHLFFLTKKSEKKAFKIADHVFHMECNRKKYSCNAYSDYCKKFSFLDFPLIDYNDAKKEIKKGQTTPIVMLYSGTLDETYRSPKYFMELYDLVSQETDVQIHFYAKGNSVPDLEKRSQKNDSIKCFGYVQKKDLEDRIESADYLVSIGNKYSDMLPSKLLAYFMTGKPIIHVKNQENDACIKYLEKYGLYTVIDESVPMEINESKLYSFIMDNRNKRLSQERISSSFEHNTPKWNAQQIMKVLTGEANNVCGVYNGSIDNESGVDR